MTLFRGHPTDVSVISEAEKRRQEDELRYWQYRAEVTAKRAGLQRPDRT
jgi:hypothetical protein